MLEVLMLLPSDVRERTGDPTPLPSILLLEEELLLFLANDQNEQ